MAETLDNLNVRDDILSTEKSRQKTSKSEEEEEESNVKDEFEEFLSTGKVRSDSFFDQNEKSSNEEKDFYEFLSTGKYRQKSKDNFYGKDNDFNEINSDLKDFLSKENRLYETKGNSVEEEEEEDILSNDLSTNNNRRFKRSSTRSVEPKNGVTRIDDYFASQDSLFGGSTWDGHYLGDIW